MKNNLLKTVAVIAIAVAMLATTVTSFAATATTVTTYNETTEKLHVVSTISDVDAGVMVTYLASSKADGSVSNKDDIVYIGQKTASEGEQIVFSYDAPSKAITSAKLLYGSNLSAVATALNGDANKAVRVAGVEISEVPEGTVLTIVDKDGNPLDGKTATLGNSETGSLTIDLPDLYELKSVEVDGVDQDITTGAFQVKGGSAVVVECVYIATEKVELDGAKQYFVQEIGEGGVTLDTVGLVCKINGTYSPDYTYGVYAVDKNGEAFVLGESVDVEGETKQLDRGYYPAVVNAEDGGYYAVQLASEADLTGVKLYPYYNDGTGTGNIIIWK